MDNNFFSSDEMKLIESGVPIISESGYTVQYFFKTIFVNDGKGRKYEFYDGRDNITFEERIRDIIDELYKENIK